jgi:hypothetical protein
LWRWKGGNNEELAIEKHMRELTMCSKSTKWDVATSERREGSVDQREGVTTFDIATPR